jgi:chromosome segregation ATPase
MVLMLLLIHVYLNTNLSLEEAADQLFGYKETMDHHLEHELASVNDHIETLINKVSKREDVAEERLKQLEDAIKRDVDSSMNTRMNFVERHIRMEMKNKMDAMEQSIQELKAHTAATNMYAMSSAAGWRVPFVLLTLLILGALVGLFFFYQHLLKKWKLP